MKPSLLKSYRDAATRLAGGSRGPLTLILVLAVTGFLFFIILMRPPRCSLDTQAFEHMIGIKVAQVTFQYVPYRDADTMIQHMPMPMEDAR
jgi:hypothetical protein